MDQEQMSINDVVFHIHNIITSEDCNLIQYLVPSYKLLRCYYAENEGIEIEKSHLELVTKTVTYPITVSKENKIDKRQVSEVTQTLCSFICDLQERRTAYVL